MQASNNMRIKRHAATGTNNVRWHHLLRRIIIGLVTASFVLLVLLWVSSGMIHSLSSDSTNGANTMIRRGATDATIVKNATDITKKRRQNTNAAIAASVEQTNSSSNNRHILSLTLDDISPPITIRIAVFKNECPKAYEFLSYMVEHQQAECNPCTIYRGEPVPSYWGSKDYPDRYFDGGRWGPPYALVQGGLVNSKYKQVEQDNHRPKVLQRGMVAWAGGNSIHFFIALADHPEWGDFHTVWGEVLNGDMTLVDALVKEHPLKVLEHNNPVLTNFVEPMHFHLKWE